MANFQAKSLSVPLRTSSFWGVVGLLMLLGASFAFALSNRAVAGDALYFLDLRAERTALRFVNDELARAKLYSSLSEERLGELEVLVARHERALGTGNQERMMALRQQAVESYSLSLARVEVVEEYLQAKQATLSEGVAKDQIRGVLRYFQQLEQNRADRVQALWKQVGSAAEGISEPFGVTPAQLEEVRTEIEQEFKQVISPVSVILKPEAVGAPPLGI